MLCFVLVAVIVLGRCSSAEDETMERLVNLSRNCNVESLETLNLCLLHLSENMKPHLAKGIPEWGIPAMDPLRISSAVFRQGGASARLRASFRDMEVHGLTDYNVSYVSANPASNRLTVGLSFPVLRASGRYEVAGHLLLVPLSGSGLFWTLMDGVTVDSYNWIDVVSSETGSRRLQLKNTQTDFDIRKIQVRLHNLFGGDRFMGDTVNAFLNENAQTILLELKPRFVREIDRIVLHVFGEALNAMPTDKWLAAIF